MAVVQVNENTLDFIFDESVNNYTISGGDIGLLVLNYNTKIYMFNENKELIDSTYSVSMNGTTLMLTYHKFGETGNEILIGFLTNDGAQFGVSKINAAAIEGVPPNVWLFEQQNGTIMQNIKGFRIENFAYAEGQTLETINTLVNPYIGTKTSFAKTYTLRVNGKLLNTINGKKIRNLIYNGTTYEIAEPVASGYTLTLDYSNIDNNSDLPLNIQYTTNTGETGSFRGIGTMILNNVESITFEGTLDDSFIPYLTSCNVGSTKGGSEYGSVGVYAEDTPLTLNITENKTIYLYGTYAKPAPDIPMP